MEKSEHAAMEFRSGLNCAQAVLGEYVEEFGADADSAARIACGFGGGMGHTGGTCGAVTGAIMVLGLAACDSDPRDTASRIRTYGLVQSFLTEFNARHGATDCRRLLGCDISTPEGYSEAQISGLFETRCEVYVKDAIELLETML